MTSDPKPKKRRAPRNRTLEIDPSEVSALRASIVYELPHGEPLEDKIICGDTFDILKSLLPPRPFDLLKSLLPPRPFDLLFADPPYNLTKTFGQRRFAERAPADYEEWLDSWLTLCRPLLSETASVYICGDWRSGSSIQHVGSKYFKLQNRITWEREKGRGAKANWKNSAEDIWFFTVSDRFTFNLESVKQRRRVLAPYKENGRPKDWSIQSSGKFRDTHPSNIWTDISVPFWSMPENTDHPTQKPEKLLAKILLASTDPGDLILDPFAGSGTSAVAAKKLDRNFIAIESDEQYCLLAQKRLLLAENERSIQGFVDGVFWERNSTP
jgi:site-specific DNA-methyltransferase (adenine-specific)